MERDYPNIEFKNVTCIYCDNPFIESVQNMRMEWEHLDGDSNNSTFENMAWAHKSCNHKKENDTDLQLIAKEKYRQNLRWAEMHDPIELLQKGSRYNSDKDKSDSTNVSTTQRECCIEVLTMELYPINGRKAKRESLAMNLACDLAVFLCNEKIGRGSQTAAKRHFQMLACEYSKEYELRTLNGNEYIFRSSR